ncbi:MAG TPA: tetratricopeptide repeat protein [Thermoanaerobaculia bacterium]|nr:tetratricopeptide repeat protein [Thermoanaerobaculia bacterium]
MVDDSGSIRVFEDLRERGRQAVESGRLEEALALYQQSAEVAEAIGDPKLQDLALCNVAAAAISLGRGDGEVPRLREILLRNESIANCCLAAYNIARYYELTKDFKKSLFYARIARDRSEVLGRIDWIASSYNQIGNALLAESLIEEACRHYEKALAMYAEPSIRRALMLDNLGYCRVLQSRFSDGYSLIYQSLAMLRRVGPRRYQLSPRLDLCFAHLETGRYEKARNHGRVALAIAEAAGDSDATKNALYLLGETANLLGDSFGARRYFSRLQQGFFPDQPYLPSFLLAIDVRKLINLKA